jgi:aldehyde dehydrogenase (NAD+)
MPGLPLEILDLNGKRMIQTNGDHETFYIGGEWVRPSSSEILEVRSPATEEIIGRVPSGSVQDIDRAVRAARDAFDHSDWPWLAMAERAKYVEALADGIEKRRDEFAVIGADESGQPVVKNGLRGVNIALRAVRYYAALGKSYAMEQVRQGVDNPFIQRQEPVGVVGIIAPWNAPLSVTLFSLPAALIAGCTIVLKPAPETPLYAQLLARIIEEIGIPPGVVNVVPAGREASESLVRHPGVDKISFTGSTATGRRIGALCGENLKRVSLELGGKSAAIILEDADLARVMPGIVGTALANSGEACVGQTRILVPQSRYSEITDAFVAGVSAKKMGDPHEPDTDLGPLIAERQRARVEGYITSGLEEGARLVLGGGRPKHLTRGWYVEPTIFADVNNEMRIAREEIFGPVLCILPYVDEKNAIAIANDSPYGLSGTVWTSDQERGIEIARRVRTGNYGVNTLNLDSAAPFGGFKESGIGRQLGTQGLESFFETKAIQLPPIAGIK